MNNKKRIRIFLSVAAVVVLAACDGISGTGGPSRGTDGDQSGKQTPGSGQAVLGPIVGATVTLRDIEDINAIACSATTADNSDLAKAGAINFSAPCVFKDHLYVVTVTGGNDIDYDDDGVRDATPTPNTGEFRALLSGEQLLQNNWKTNALTESVYQAMQYAVQTGNINIAATIDQIAQQLIKQDLNGDQVIDHRDIALWHPVTDAKATINSRKLRFSTALIHRNLNRTLVDIPDAEALAGHINTLAPARQVLTHGDDLLITTDTALLIYHYENADANLLSSLALGWIYDIATVGNSLYVALGENGIAQIDVTDGTNPQILQRWTNPAERITTLGDRIIFSYVNETGQDALAEIAGTSATVIATSEPERLPLPRSVNIRKYSSDESASSGLLQTIGNTVYWSPANTLLRFVFDGDQWNQYSPLLTRSDFNYMAVVDDVEVFNDTLYIVYRTSKDPWQVFALMDFPEFYTAPLENQYDILLTKLTRQVDLIDISNAAAPVAVASYDHDDISAIRRWDGDIVALGERDVSIRYPADLRSKLSLRLPETFSGFYPSKGLTRVNDTLVVAAKENGVLFLTTTNIPVKKYYGHAFSEGPVANSRVVVTSRPANTGSCELQSDGEGMISVPESCIADNTYYDVAVIGGEQIVGGETQPFLGTMRATIHSSILMQSGWMVSPLTEMAWRLFEKSAAQDFNGISAAYSELSYQWLQDDGDYYRRDYDIARWDPRTESQRLLLAPEMWQLATQNLRTATWNDDITARLLAPYAGFYVFDESIRNVVATEDLVFVAHQDSIDVLSHNSNIEWLQNLPGGADKIFSYNNVVTAINTAEHRLKTYRTESGNHLTQTRDVSDPFLDNMPALCAAGDRLFSLIYADDSHIRVTAWNITDNGLQKIDSVLIPPLELNDNVKCSDDTIVTNDSYRFDVIKFVDNRLTLAEGTQAPTGGFISDTFFDGTEVYLASEDRNDGTSRRYVYTLDSNGHPLLTHNINLQSNFDERIAGYAEVDGKKYIADGWEKLMLADAVSKQNVVEIALPADRIQGLITRKQNVWIWVGNSIWTVDASKALADQTR